MQLTLTVDLPPTDYSIADEPTMGQHLASVIKAVYLFFAAIGWLMIDAVDSVGDGLEWGIEATYRAVDSFTGVLATVDGMAIVAIAAVVGLVLNRTVIYVG